MPLYYETKVRYDKIDERSGKEKRVTTPYIVDAVSFTEAEERIHKELSDYISGEFDVTHISRTKIQEIHEFDADGWWFLCKIAIVDADEKTGKEKASNMEILVNAENMTEAKERVDEVMKTCIVPWSIKNIKETSIEEVYKYIPEDKEQIQD